MWPEKGQVRLQNMAFLLFSMYNSVRIEIWKRVVITKKKKANKKYQSCVGNSNFPFEPTHEGLLIIPELPQQ